MSTWGDWSSWSTPATWGSDVPAAGGDSSGGSFVQMHPKTVDNPREQLIALLDDELLLLV